MQLTLTPQHPYVSQKQAAVPPFTAPEEFCKACHVSSREQFDQMYKRSIEDPEGFWGDIANEFHWEKKARPLVLPCLPLCVRCMGHQRVVAGRDIDETRATAAGRACTDAAPCLAWRVDIHQAGH